MIINNIKEILEKETLELIENLENEISILEQSLGDAECKYNGLLSENYVLKMDIEDLKAQTKNVQSIRELLKVNNDNLMSILPLFGFKIVDNTNNGMYNPPAWFEAWVRYHDQKERLFQVLDLLEVNYPDYAKTMKMPYEYDEIELDHVFSNMNNMLVCNGEMLNNNLGFWFNECFHFGFDAKKSCEHNYSEIPWQYILRNPLLLTEKYFNKIIASLTKNESHSYMFYNLYQYQKLNKDQINKLTKCLSDHKGENWKTHWQFLENNFHEVDDQYVLDKLFEKVSDNEYSTMSWVRFPKEYQIAFIKKQKTLQNQISFVFKATKLSEEEKKKLIVELSS